MRQIIASLFILQFITSDSIMIMHHDPNPGKSQKSFLTHTERERVIANRQRNKIDEKNRHLMKVLDAVANKRDIKDYVNNKQLLEDLGLDLTPPQDHVQSPRDDEKSKRTNGLRVINVTGTRMNHDSVEFNVPDLLTSKKVTSVKLKVMIESRDPKNLRKSMEKVKVEVYAPTNFGVESTSGPSLFFGTLKTRNQRRSFPALPTTATMTTMKRHRQTFSLKELTLISSIDLEPNKTKWAFIPLPNIYIQDVMRYNITRLKFVIDCDQCRGIGRRRRRGTKRRMENRNRNSTEKQANRNKNNSSSIRMKQSSSTNTNRSVNNSKDSSITRQPKKQGRRNVRHSSHNQNNKPHQIQKQSKQQHQREQNYLPQLLIYTKDK